MTLIADAVFAPSDYARMYLPTVLLILLIAVLFLTTAIGLYLAIRKKTRK